jgi:subtilisin family serine protease
MRPITWRALAAPALIIALAGASEAQAAPGESIPSTDLRAETPDERAVAKAERRAEQQGKARVVVTLRMKFTPLGELDKADRLEQRSEIADLQAQTADVLDEGKVVRRFETLPLMAVVATPGEIEALAASDRVADVRLDGLAKPALATSTSQVGSATVNSRGIGGAGQTVAVLDTGVDNSHPFFAGRIVDEACFAGPVTFLAAGSCPDGSSVMIGSGAGDNCPTFISGCDHGTHVAGIAAGAAGPNGGSNGVAPEAGVMAVNVFHRVDNFVFNLCGSDPSPCVRAWWSDIAAGLQHVFLRRTQFNIAAVNVSIGDSTNWTSQCTGSGLRMAIDNLRSAGIATVVSAGNDGNAHGLSEPACVPGVVSVGAVDSADSVAGFSNSATYLSLLAPGVGVRSSVPGGGFDFMSGTSMAAPHVTGAFALMKQAHPNAGVTEILARLQQTGRQVFDPKAGRSTKRLDVDRSIRYSSFTSDFNRDLRADFAVWRPSTHEWWIPGQGVMLWGDPGDKPVPGDYNGDGDVEKAIWRPSTGVWWVPGVGTFQWGQQGDVPVPGDYNGDGKHDLAVWRPSTGTWWIHNQTTQQWGLQGDTPVPADYNGDGRTDMAVWRPSNGTWYVLNQSTVQWGLPGDQPVPADYNGDGRADVAVWRPSDGVWHVRHQFSQQWGLAGDIATPRDVTGDGTAELVVWRPSNGTWFTLTRIPFIGNVTSSFQWGQQGDVPVGATATQLK